MPLRLLHRVTPPALVLSAMSSAAFAGAPEDCQDNSLDAQVQIAACTDALAAETDPAQRADLLSKRGRTYEWIEDFDAAEADYREELRLAPDSAIPLVDLSWLADRRGEADVSFEFAERAYALEPENAEVLERLAWSLHDAKRPDDCVARAGEAIAIDPDRYYAHSAKGACLVDLARHEEALPELDRALALGEDPAWIAQTRALAYYGLGRLDEAAESAQVALDADPTDAVALKTLLDTRLDQGRADEALALYEAHSQAVGPEAMRSEHIWNNMAWRFYLAGDLDQARRFIGFWSDAAPTPTEADVNEIDTLAHILAAQGDTERAAEGFVESMRLGGPEREAYYREKLAALGIMADPGPEEVEAGLRTCAARGADCRLY